MIEKAKLSPIYNAYQHPVKEGSRKLDSDIRNDLIKQIAKKSFIELVVSLAFVGLACLFIATPVGMMTMLIAAVAACALNILFRSLGAFATYRIQQLENSELFEDKVKIKQFQTLQNFMNILTPMAFSGLVDRQTRVALTNSIGQAAAASILYNDAKIKISLSPFNLSDVSITANELSKMGEVFGKNKIESIVTAAGPALSIISASIGIGGAALCSGSHPELSRYLKAMAIDSIAHNVFNAIAALIESAATHNDFVKLWAGGLHPIAAIVGMVAIPILVRIGIFIYQKVKAVRAEEKAEQYLNHIIRPPMRQTIYKLANS